MGRTACLHVDTCLGMLHGRVTKIGPTSMRQLVADLFEDLPWPSRVTHATLTMRLVSRSKETGTSKQCSEWICPTLVHASRTANLFMPRMARIGNTRCSMTVKVSRRADNCASVTKILSTSCLHTGLTILAVHFLDLTEPARWETLHLMRSTSPMQAPWSQEFSSLERRTSA